MKREFLQNFKVGDQALPKEIIDAIMDENGRDIEAAKKPFADMDASGMPLPPPMAATRRRLPPCWMLTHSAPARTKRQISGPRWKRLKRTTDTCLNPRPHPPIPTGPARMAVGTYFDSFEKSEKTCCKVAAAELYIVET